MNKKFFKRVSLGVALSFIVSNFCFNFDTVKADTAYSYTVSTDSNGFKKPDVYSGQVIMADEYTDTPGHKQTAGANDADGWEFHQTVMFPRNQTDLSNTGDFAQAYDNSITGAQAMANANYGIDSNDADDQDSHYYLNYKFRDVGSDGQTYNYPNLIYYRTVQMYGSDQARIGYQINRNSFTRASGGAVMWQPFPSYTSCHKDTDYVHDYHLATITANPTHTAPTADFYFNSGDSTETVSSGQTVQVIDGTASDTYDNTSSLFWSTYYTMDNNIDKHGSSHSLPQSYTYDDAIIVGSAWSIYDSNGNNVTSQFHTQLGTKDSTGAATNFSFTPDSSITPGTYYVGHSVVDNWGNIVGKSNEQKRSFTVSSAPQSHTMTVHYIDTSNVYTDLVTPDPTSTTGQYTPTAPSGYTLTGNYRTSPSGVDIPYYTTIDESPLTSDTDVYVMCTQSTPVSNVYRLNISYIDESTNQPIYTGLAGCDQTKNYGSSDLTLEDDGGEYTYYMPSQAPSGYTLDTSKYKSSSLGYVIGFNVSSDLAGSNGISSSSIVNLKVYCNANAPVTPVNPTPTPTTGDYTANISYVDEATTALIVTTAKGYSSSDVTQDFATMAMGDNTVGAWYNSTYAPTGYTVDTSKFSDSTLGYHLIWDIDDSRYLPHNGWSSTSTANLTIYCIKDTTPVIPVPPPTPVITTGTVMERYFVAGIEQTADENTIYNVSAGLQTYNCAKSYTGYTCTNPTVYVNVTAGELSYADFYFKKNSSPPTAYINAPSTVHQGTTFTVTGSGYDPQGEALTYYWKTSDGQTISGTQGTLKMGDESIAVTLYVQDTEGLKSEVVSKTISPKNNPPVVSLNLPPTVTLGDDLNVTAVGSDPDGDSITYSWNTPDGMTGSIAGSSGTVQFKNKDDIGKQKNFTVTVTDSYGGTGTATASTTVVAPKPTVSITQSGTLKENRKVTLSETSDGGSDSFPIDNTKIQWAFYDSSNTLIAVTNTADSGTVESLNSMTGTTSVDLLFTKPGTYTAKCTVYNTDGDTAVDSKTIIILPDVAPIASFSTNNAIVYRDSNNSNRSTTTLTDSSYSTDGDSINKRLWFYCFDSNNDKNDEDETWYIYKDGSWQQFGSYADIKALLNSPNEVDSINSGNLTSVQVTPKNFYRDGEWQSHVGDYYYKEIVREQYGQDTNPSLITSKDYKVNIR